MSEPVHRELLELKQSIEAVTKITNIFSDVRRVNYIIARAIFYDIAFNKFGWSVLSIAQFANKNHATVMHALKNIDSTYAKERALMYNKIKIDLENYYINLLNKPLQGYEVISLDKSLLKIAELRQELAYEKLKIDEYKKQLDNFSLFLEIPKDKQNEFIETRLKPYLKMNV